MAVGASFDSARAWSAEHALVLTIAFAAALRVRFDVGAGVTQPVQLAFVPMLLLLPTPWVPLLVLAGLLLERLPALARSDLHPSRLLLVPGNAWFALGPVVVLCIGGAQIPDWTDWPVYIAALAAQLAVDLVAGEVREWLGRGIAPSLQLRAMGIVPLIDALLSPLGLLAAFASREMPFAYLLLVPPAALLTVYARERARRLQSAIDLIESERAAVRSREALVAGASHELLTPMAVVSGLVHRLAGGSELDAHRREEAEGALRREVTQLRHLTRQFVDYTRLKAGEPLRVRPRATSVIEVLEDVAGTYAARADVSVRRNGARPVAAVDPDRLRQMVMALISNAVKHAPRAPIHLRVRTAGDRIEVVVSDDGPGVPAGARCAIFEELRQGPGSAEGAGIGLFLCRHLAREHGGDLRLDGGDGHGATFVISLPTA